MHFLSFSAILNKYDIRSFGVCNVCFNGLDWPRLKISFWDVSFPIIVSVDLVVYLVWQFQVMRTIDLDGISFFLIFFFFFLLFRSFLFHLLLWYNYILTCTIGLLINELNKKKKGRLICERTYLHVWCAQS